MDRTTIAQHTGPYIGRRFALAERAVGRTVPSVVALEAAGRERRRD